MITTKELLKLQKLAKLNFTDEEITSFTKKLNNVMEMIDKIQEVDCSSVEPLRSVCDMDQRMRPDEVKVANLSEQLFSNVPEQGLNLAKELKCFIVPKVVE